MTKKYLDNLTYKVLGAAINVHKELGPGLLESVYQQCLLYEFRFQNIAFTSESIVPVTYREMELDVNLRCDFVIEECLIVEIKAVESILPIHEAQLLTYMKLFKAPKGILINFNTVNLASQGKKTFVNELFRNLPDS